MKAKRLYDPVFRATVDFLFDCTADEVNEWYKKHKIGDKTEKQDKNGFSMEIENSWHGQTITEFLIVVYNVDDFYTLSHELIHLVRNVFAQRKLNFDSDNDEAIAYYHEYWLRRFWRLMDKKK
jgi:hypothetical protein